MHSEEWTEHFGQIFQKAAIDQTYSTQSDLQDVFDQTPRFLFRVYSPKSNGYSDEKSIISAAAYRRRESVDIFTLSTAEAGAMVRKHLNWRTFQSNLVSWTSSFLFALQLALRRKHTEPKRESKDVRLCVVDTHKLPRGSFIPAKTLLVAFGVDMVVYDPDYTCHEYFAQGAMDIEGSSITTNLDMLLKYNTLELFPELRTTRKKLSLLAGRVSELRQRLFLNKVPASAREVDLARTMARECFGESFAPPMFVTILALRSRPLNDNRIFDEVKKTAWDMGLYDESEAVYDETREHGGYNRLLPEPVPERIQYVEFMHALKDVRRSEHKYPKRHSSDKLEMAEE